MRKPIFHDDKPYKSFLESEEYEDRERSGSPAQKSPIVEYKEEKEERPRKITVERRTIHKMLREEELEPLRKVSPKVIGNLFDRVEFLKQRLTETRAGLDTRKVLHKDLVAEINADIKDKNEMLGRLTDVDDIRDFKLDISTLRMERRRENVQFWRDIMDLTMEIRELIEEYQMESKIANLFKGLQPGV